jgi:putative ABC transport system permease protein
LTLVFAGVAIGVPLALAIGKIASSRISGLLFGLQAHDATTILSATVVLAVVAGLAAFLPARGASHIDPIVALRNE